MSINRMKRPSEAKWSQFYKEIRVNHREVYEKRYQEQTAAIKAAIHNSQHQKQVKADAQLYRNKGIKRM